MWGFVLQLALFAVFIGVSTSQTECLQSISDNPPTTCQTWHYRDNTTNVCKCGGEGYNTHLYISCYSNEDCAYHTKHPSTLKAGNCLTYDNDTQLTFLGKCPYSTLWSINPTNTLTTNVLELNDQICGPLNRTGLLCSQCAPGLGPAMFSYYRECKECIAQPWGWILFLVRLILPLTIFCVIVILFQINIASPALNGFVLFVQLHAYSFNNFPFQIHGLERSYSFPKFVSDLYGIFNLDFFTYAIPSFCIAEGMSELTVLALQYIEALYPLLFTLVVYAFITLHDNGCKLIVHCWRPFHKYFVRFRRSWDLKGSVVNAFATFVLLSFCKFCSISLYLLQPVQVWDICGRESQQMYYDASNKMYSRGHTLYLIIAVLVMSIFVSLPALFVLFYQNRFFQKCLSTCRFRFVLLHELANITQGCFKNGTEPNTRDYRWCAGLYLILRVLLVFFLNQLYYELMYTITPSIAAFLVLTLRPYRVDWCNIVDGFFWISLSVGTTWRLFWSTNDQAWRYLPDTLKLLPLGYLMCYLSYQALMLAKNRLTIRGENIPERLREKTNRSPIDYCIQIAASIVNVHHLYHMSNE